MFWHFTVWINCSSDLKIFANSRPSASNYKSFSRSLEFIFFTIGQNNYGNKIPFFLLIFLVISSLLFLFLGESFEAFAQRVGTALTPKQALRITDLVPKNMISFKFNDYILTAGQSPILVCTVCGNEGHLQVSLMILDVM